MSLKKKRILKCSLFIFITLILFAYSLFLFIPRTLKGSEATRFYRGKGYKDEEKNSLDVVMIGTSDAFSCFSPCYMYEKYGIRSYNCGVSKQSCVGMKRQLKDLLKYQKPKAIIVETDAIYYRNMSDTAYVAEKACDYVGKYHCFWKDMDELRKNRIIGFCGLLTAALALFTLLSCVSYLFTWRQDMSLLQDPGRMALSESVANWGGKLGAKWGYLLVYRWFGVGSFALVLLLVILSAAALLLLR